MRYLLIIAALVFYSCNPPSIKDNKKSKPGNEENNKLEGLQDSKYILAFAKVDNTVNVYVNDSLIYTSGFIGHSPELDLKVDLGQFIADAEDRIRIELFNGYPPYDDQIDPLWEVRYDLIINGEIVDFIHEYADDNGIGKVYENEYIIGEWTDI